MLVYTQRIVYIITVCILYIFCLLFVIIIQNSLIALAGTESAGFVTGRMPYGIPLEKWAMEWWQWVVTMPASETQIDPTTQKNKCVLGSDPDGRMIFLISPYEIEYTTDYTISSERSILIPLLVGECDPTLDDVRVKTGKIEDLWACARETDEVFKSWDVTLDGKTLFKKIGNEEVNMYLKDEILVRNSSSFTLNIPEVNRYEVEKGSYTAVVDGYYLIIKPLPMGTHTLKYSFVHEKIAGGLKIPSGESSATYIFTVK